MSKAESLASDSSDPESTDIAQLLADPATLECLRHLRERGAYRSTRSILRYWLIRAAIAMERWQLNVARYRPSNSGEGAAWHTRSW